MLKAKDLMTTPVETLAPHDDIDLASMLMRLDRLHHLPVVDEGRLVGLISDRDILRAERSTMVGATKDEARRFNMKIRASEVMTDAVQTIAPDTSAVEAAQIMRERGFGCLPVVDDGEVVGIVTPRDYLGLVVELLLA